MSDQNLFAAPARLRRLQIEITTGCNLRCAGCQRTLGMAAGTWHNTHMPTERFAAILRHAPPADAIILQGIGEPTLHPALPGLVRMARETGRYGVVSFNTNALLRDTAYYADLKAVGLGHVSVSVDSLEPKTAEALRAGTDTRRLAAGIRELAALFDGQVTLSVVLSRRNLHELDGLLTRLHGLGGRIVEIQPLVSYDQTIEPLALTAEDRATALGIIAGVRSRLPDLTVLSAAALTPNGGRCRRPFHAAYVTVEGYLTPCCLTNDADLMGRVSLAAIPFAQAWQSEGVRRFTASYFEHEPSFCHGCAFNPSGASADGRASAVATTTLAAGQQALRDDDAIAAETHFRRLTTDPVTAEALQGLGLARLMAGQADQAIPFLRSAHLLRPGPRVAHNLAMALEKSGARAEALALERATVAAHPDYVPSWHGLSAALDAAGNRTEAAGVELALAERCAGGANEAVAAVACARAAMLDPGHPRLLAVANRLRIAGFVDAATHLLDARLAADPRDLGARLSRAMGRLTVVHGSEADIADRRAAYLAELEALDAALTGATAAERAAGAAMVGNAKPFFLSYHGLDDTDPQRRYGRIVSHLTAAVSPACEVPPTAGSSTAGPSANGPSSDDPSAIGQSANGQSANGPSANGPSAIGPSAALETAAIQGTGTTQGTGGIQVAAASRPGAGDHRIRVGFATAYFHLHSVSKLFGGWIRGLDPARFAVTGYHLGEAEDAMSADLAGHCAQFHRGPRPEADWIATMLADRLDVLIYPEIGMHPLPVRLGCRRLAPVQCVAWGHPVTTGLPAIDHFLSSALMEPDDGDSHYTENLVRLPNLSIDYQPPAADTGTLTRERLGLPTDAVVYVCCQSLFKYHPGDDRILAAIARRVPSARFLFIGAIAADPSARRLADRLRASFRADGLDADRHVVFTPPVPHHEFPALLRCGDVYLDSPRWSGGNTTLEAMAVGLPIVTLPGRMMRARHSAAILLAAGAEAWIAWSAGHYVDLAASLADPAKRAIARGAILAGRARVYGAQTPVRALEAFLSRAVGRETRREAA